jgi:hypothetical protein
MGSGYLPGGFVLTAVGAALVGFVGAVSSGVQPTNAKQKAVSSKQKAIFIVFS